MSQELNLEVAERIAMREKDSNALALIARIRELERAQPADMSISSPKIDTSVAPVDGVNKRAQPAGEDRDASHSN